jgi:sugar phosphate isomerase/epimerase
MAATMGDRLTHVHIADGNGSARDEHLVPGRGEQPCAELLEGLAGAGLRGAGVAEINTRTCEDRPSARPTWRRRWPSPGSPGRARRGGHERASGR